MWTSIIEILRPFKVLFGNSFGRITKEPEHYAKRRGNRDFSLSLAEVKCTVGIIMLRDYHMLPSRKNFWNKNQIWWSKLSVTTLEGTGLKKFCSFFMLLTPATCQKIKKRTCIRIPWWTSERISKLIASGTENLI